MINLLRLLLCAGLALIIFCGCNRSPAPTSSSNSAQKLTPTFIDATSQSGLNFTHFSGMAGKWYMPEMVGPGAALFDFDNDSDLDLFIVQGCPIGPEHPQPAAPSTNHHRLFRNDLSNSTVRWTDISAEVGLTQLPTDYGMGVAVGDYNNDGFADLYITSYGPNRVLKNAAGKHLLDVTPTTPGDLAEPRWSVSASWLDFDRDGWLDLVCINYLDFTFQRHRDCFSKTGALDYCGPQAYPPLPARLWHNLGNGGFEDITASAGLLSREGAGLGVVAADFDNDGSTDFLAANDGMANFLWLNQKNGTFKESAMERGCALNGMGASEANMGVIAADFDEDGDQDLVITHLDGEKMTLFENWKNGYFSDISTAAGLDAPTRRSTGFGVAAIDFDNDGWQDIICANGAVKVIESQRGTAKPAPMLQHAQLFRGIGAGKFTEITNEPALQVMEIGRGLAHGDVDNDGDTDIILANNSGPARFLVNQSAPTNWLGVDLRLPKLGNRPALGATLKAQLSDGRTLHRRCATDGSYASGSDPRIVLGLGAAKLLRLQVTWPDATTSEWTDLPVNRYHTLVPKPVSQ